MQCTGLGPSLNSCTGGCSRSTAFASSSRSESAHTKGWRFPPPHKFQWLRLNPVRPRAIFPIVSSMSQLELHSQSYRNRFDENCHCQHLSYWDPVWSHRLCSMQSSDSTWCYHIPAHRECQLCRPWRWCKNKETQQERVQSTRVNNAGAPCSIATYCFTEMRDDLPN